MEKSAKNLTADIRLFIQQFNKGVKFSFVIFLTLNMYIFL